MEVTTYYINNIPIYIRSLPSGCISVWHPYNIELAYLVYEICHGKGYWNGEYKNWLIFERFANNVIQAIEESGHPNVR